MPYTGSMLGGMSYAETPASSYVSAGGSSAGGSSAGGSSAGGGGGGMGLGSFGPWGMIAQAIITVANTAAQAYLQHGQTDILKRQARLNKYIARINAKAADLAAEDALSRGREQETRVRGAIKKTVGSQRAAFAAQGIRLDQGSPQDVQQETQDIGEYETLQVRLNAMKEAYGYKTQGIGYRMQAIGYGAAGAVASSQGKAAVSSTILGGINQIGTDALKRYGSGV